VEAHRGDQAQAQVDDGGRERAPVLVGQRRDRGDERQSDAEQADGVGVAGGQAELGRDRSHRGPLAIWSSTASIWRWP
jgi:hypothetical protein